MNEVSTAKAVQLNCSSGIKSDFEPNDLGSNSAWFTGFNQEIAVGKISHTSDRL